MGEVMKNLATAIAALALAGASILPATAGDYTGWISASGGMYNNSSTDDGGGKYGFVALDGTLEGRFSSNLGWALDARGEAYDWESADNLSEQPEYTGVLAAHLTRSEANGVHWGAFAGYGHSWLNRDDDYSMWMAGLEGQTMMDDFHIFGQIGYGDNIRSDGEEEGFNRGSMVRAGGSYFLWEDTSFGVEGTLANANPYIDGNDEGEFSGATLHVQTRVLDTPIHARAYASFNHYDATSEDDTLNERIYGLTLTYRFNGETSQAAARRGASLGVPLVPIYANGWAEQID